MIGRIVVEPTWWGRGIARAALTQATERVGQEGATVALYTTVLRTARIAVQAGYTRLGVRQIAWGGLEREATLFMRPPPESP
jgi:GNAT superfamily N-acetyltransferase